MEPTTTTTDDHEDRQPAGDVSAPASGVTEELLVEEISIDGMCGVY